MCDGENNMEKIRMKDYEPEGSSEEEAAVGIIGIMQRWFVCVLES
jgi:hypothetical protein